LLAASGDVGAIRALVVDGSVPVDVRLAIVATFLPDSPDREVGVRGGDRRQRDGVHVSSRVS
jgi:hypothetical protein